MPFPEIWPYLKVIWHKKMLFGMYVRVWLVFSLFSGECWAFLDFFSLFGIY